MNETLNDLIKPLTVPASWAYGAAVAARNRGFDRGRRVQRIDRPVISVGNISVGGVGKSPLVAWIAARLMGEGHTPCIAMRGYLARPGEMGDEEAEYRERLPGVHVVADPNRAEAIARDLVEHPEVDAIILDDGFQHRFVHRDLDLVLIDATRDTLRDQLLPVGRLREPLANLKRADGVIVTHANASDELITSRVERHHGRPPLAWCDHHWSHVRVFRGSPDEEQIPTEQLRNMRLVTLLGVGNPKAIIGQLEGAGAMVLANIPAGDHERYDRGKLNVACGLCEGADGLVMTAKDWVKARHLIRWERLSVPVIVPHLELDVHTGSDDLWELIRKTVEEGRRDEP